MNNSLETTPKSAPLSLRKQTIKALADQVADHRTTWIARNQFYYDDHYRFMRVLTPPCYAARNYGVTQISRFRDGWLLVRMITFAWRKLKAI